MALEEVDRITATEVRFGLVLADPGYGNRAAFRRGLNERRLRWAVRLSRHDTVPPGRRGPGGRHAGPGAQV